MMSIGEDEVDKAQWLVTRSENQREDALTCPWCNEHPHIVNMTWRQIPSIKLACLTTDCAVKPLIHEYNELTEDTPNNLVELWNKQSA